MNRGNKVDKKKEKFGGRSFIMDRNSFKSRDIVLRFNYKANTSFKSSTLSHLLPWCNISYVISYYQIRIVPYPCIFFPTVPLPLFRGGPAYTVLVTVTPIRPGFAFKNHLKILGPLWKLTWKIFGSSLKPIWKLGLHQNPTIYLGPPHRTEILSSSLAIGCYNHLLLLHTLKQTSKK